MFTFEKILVIYIFPNAYISFKFHRVPCSIGRSLLRNKAVFISMP